MTDWWNTNSDQGGVGDYDPSQTAAAQNPITQTTYSPPGQDSPIDQYNYVPDPNSPGGYQTYGPGQMAPADLPSFSNTTGQYPNDQEMAQSVSNNIDLSPTIDQQGNAQFAQDYAALGQNLQQYTPQATVPGWDRVDLGNGNAATYYQDGSVVIWNIATGQQVGGWGAQQNPVQAYGPPGVAAPGNYNTQYPGQNQPAGAAPAAKPPGGYLPNGQYATGNQWWMAGAIPAQLKYAQSMPGYLPGSMTYNQFRLDQPGLIGPVGPNNVVSNLQWGSGGPGDPNTGSEPQTPQQWVQGGKLFEWDGNMGTPENGTQGLGYIGNLFGRSDTPSGIGTPAWDAPKQYWDGLAQQVGAGRVRPTNRGWAALLAKGYTPAGIGGSAIQQAASVGVQPNGAGSSATGTGGAGGTGPMGAGTEPFNQAQAYQMYLTARMNNLEIPGMNQQNQQFHDQLAFEQAKQAFLEKYQQQVFGEQQRQFNEQNALAQGQLTGTFNGAPTLANQQFQQQTSLGYLNLLAQLRGPSDIFQYLKVLQGTPGGMQDIVNAAAGAYRMPMTGGGNVNVGTTGTDINTLLSQLNDPNYRAQGQNLTLPPPNQINAQALMRMSPSQQQVLMAAYEQAGYRPEDVMAIFKNSLPQYAGRQQVGNVALLGR